MALGTVIQLRRDTSANWTSSNVVLAQGEPAVETDTGKLKIGDGSTAWNSLSYFAGSGGGAVTSVNTRTGDVTGLAELTGSQTFTGLQQFTPSSTSTGAIRINGLASQSETLFSVVDSGAQTVASINHQGIVAAKFFTDQGNTGVYIDTSGNRFTLVQRIAAQQPLIVKGAASQSANLTEWQDSSGNIFSRVNSSGYFGTERLGVSANGATIPLAQMVFVQPSATGNQGIVVRGAASQTANLLELQTSGGAVYGAFDANSFLTLGGTGVLNNAWLTIRPFGSTQGGVAIRGASGSTIDQIQLQSNAGTVLGGRTANAQIYSGSTTPLNKAVGGATTATSGDGTTATITTTSAHGLAVGDRVTVAGITPTGYNGTFIVTAVGTTTTFSYANATTGSQTVAGTVRVDPQVSVTARSAGTTGMIIRAASSQAANLFEIQDSAGTVLTSISSLGSINLTNSNASLSAQGGITFSRFFTGTTSSNSSYSAHPYTYAAAIRNQTTGISFMLQSPSSGTNPSFGIIGQNEQPLFFINNTGAIFNYNPEVVPLAVRAFAPAVASITAISGNGTTVTYTVSGGNKFVYGQKVTVTGATTTGYNVTNATITATTATTFSVSSSATGTTSTATATPLSPTANLQEWQNTSGTAVASVSPTGVVTGSSLVVTGGTSSQFLKADGSVDSNTYLTSAVTSLSGTTNQITASASTGSVTLSLPSAVTISGAMTAGSFVSSGGTSSQFLKADGSVDSNTYLTSYTETDTLSSVTGRGATTSSAISLTNATESTSTTSGALILSGGLGVVKNVYIGGNLNIAGNFAVTGTSTTVSTSNLSVTDSLIFLSDTQFTTDILDIGIYGAYSPTGTGHVHTGLVRDASDATWKLVSNAPEPVSNVIDFSSVTYDTLLAGSFKKNGGTSSQFLKADGSTDSSTYLTTTSASSTYAALTASQTFTGNQTITPASASGIALTITGQASQTGDYLYVQNDVLTNVFRLTSGGSGFFLGSVSAGTLSPLGRLTAVAGTSTQIGAVIRGAASQSANLQEWQDSSGNILARVTSSGSLRTGLSIKNESMDAVVANLALTAPSASSPVAVLRGAASQSANLQEWQSSASSVLASVNASGDIAGQIVQATSFFNINTSGSGIALQGTYRIRMTSGGVSFGTSSPSFGGGVNVVGILNASTAPTTNPVGGGVLYVASGALSYIGTSGSAATIINADGTSPFLNSNNPTLTRVSSTVEGGQINFEPSSEVGSSTWFIDSFWNGSATTLRIGNDTTVIASLDPSGNFNVPTGTILPMAGTTSKAPIDFTPGTNLTTPSQGAMEFDGDQLFITGDTSTGSGRQAVSAYQFGYVSTAATVTSGSPYFGSGVRPALKSGRHYLFKYIIRFTKNTAGTVRYDIASSGTISILQAECRTYATGSTTLNAVNINGTNTSSANSTVTSSMTANGQYVAFIEGFLVPSNDSRIQLNITCSAGTVTSVVDSMFMFTDLGIANTGNLA